MAQWDVMTDRLKELVLAGYSAGAVTAALNTQYNQGVTRNAVIGKIHRLGLSLGLINPDQKKRLVTSTKQRSSKPRADVKRRAPAPAAAEERAPDPAPVVFPLHEFEPIEPAPELAYEPISILNARIDQCRWIDGDATTMLCCGQKVAFKSSWCETHHSRVYEPRSRAPRAYSLDESRREQMRRDLTKVGAR